MNRAPYAGALENGYQNGLDTEKDSLFSRVPQPKPKGRSLSFAEHMAASAFGRAWVHPRDRAFVDRPPFHIARPAT